MKTSSKGVQSHTFNTDNQPCEKTIAFRKYNY